MPAKVIKFENTLKSLKIFAMFFGAIAFVSVLTLVVAVLSDPTATGPVYLALLNINLIFALAFIFYIGRQFTILFVDRAKGLIGTRLHLKLLAIFGILAIIPAVIVGIFSLALLNQGIESWFSNRVTSALDGSLQVAQSYLREKEKSLLVEAQALAHDPSLSSPTFLIDPQSMDIALRDIRQWRSFADITIYTQDGKTMAHSGSLISTEPGPLMKEFFKNPIGTGLSLQNLEDKRVTAIYPLADDTFLVLHRWLDSDVLYQMKSTQEAYKEYYTMRSSRDTMRWVFASFLALLTFGTLAVSIRQGMKLAGSIIKPVTELVHATNQVSAGDLDVRLTPSNDDELGILTQSFNRMAGQLKENRTLLEKKNQELNDRRRMTEAVLTGVSSGVMSVDVNGTIQTVNKTATEVLNAKVNITLDTINADIGLMLKEYIEHPYYEIMQDKVRITEDDKTKILLVRMVPQQRSSGSLKSVVITFDEITELLTAQKVAAWSDVARRIAHEIKNPLTPIQLSAERLRRKYTKQIPEKEQELFGTLTATIVNQVEQMRVMVNEFSDFARMPAAQMQPEDFVPILHEIVLLQQQARRDIEFTTEYPEEYSAIFNCDKAHIQRLFTNLIENSVNAIEEKEPDDEKSSINEIKIVVVMSQSGTLVTTITDTGKGLPEDVDSEKLFDPYVTTRKKGTGLGLAIVRRVVDEHGGQIRLSRREKGGTMVEVTFPLKKMKE